MKVIDLLNKIANDEYVPYRIKVNGDIYHYVYDDKMYVRDDGDKDEFYTDEIYNKIKVYGVGLDSEYKVIIRDILTIIQRGYYD